MPLFRVAVLGYGKLGRFIIEQILSEGERHGIELVFVWNRTEISHQDIQQFNGEYVNQPTSICSENKIEKGHVVRVLRDLKDIHTLHTSTCGESVDLIVEVCHPDVVHQIGDVCLEHTNLLVGSPVALVDDSLTENLLSTARRHSHRLMIATGALWGGQDIAKLARMKLLASAHIEMRFSPTALRLRNLDTFNKRLKIENLDGETRYSGSVRELASIAPNNVNTMAALSLIGLGPDRTQGCLIADSNVKEHHKIVVTIRGEKQPGFNGVFENINERKSPTATEASVTSLQTFHSFWQSILEAKRVLSGQSYSSQQFIEMV